MSWNQSLAGWLTFRTNRSRLAFADQAAACCEERAWSLVERRIMWLTPHELRGYVRARTRGLLEDVLRELPDAVAPLRQDATFRATISNCLVGRLRRRLAMAQADLGYRHAA